MRTVCLLPVAVAAWIGLFVERAKIAGLEPRVSALRKDARELVIGDRGKVAVVLLQHDWYDQNRWDLFLPDGAYRLCLGTRGIGKAGVAKPVKVATISAGRHRVELAVSSEDNPWRVSASWDGATLMETTEPKAWKTASCTEGGGEYPVSTQLDPDQPVVLFRRRWTNTPVKGNQFMSPGSEPTEGVLLWIERTK